MKPPVFSYHVRKCFAKIPTWWLKFIISRRKKFPKGLMGHLNAVLICLRNFSPDLHNPSRSFHCSQNIVPLIAKPWAGGIQLWRTSEIFSRNLELYRQKYQNDKFFTPTGQNVFAYSPNVTTKSYTFFPKNIFPKHSSGQIELMFSNHAEKKSSEVQIAYTLDPKITLGKFFFHKVNLFSKLSSEHVWCSSDNLAGKIFAKSPTSFWSNPDNFEKK